ncbi:MAG: GDSL-type esterase/lipase family protein [Marmoricola sp.]
MLYGDSITQGAVARWTWRYRLWQGLQAAGTPVDFVGPMHTVWSFTTGNMYSMEYRNPNFDTDHASYAGMTLSHPNWTIANLAGQYRPNVIVGLIGFNDIWRYGVSPQSLIDLWREQIALARQADPGVSIVLGQYGQVWMPGVSEYNADVAALAASVDRPSARVIVAQAPTFTEHEDTFDGVHLSTSGENLQAKSVAAALTQLGLDSAAAPADPTNDTAFTPVPTVTTSNGLVVASWPAVDYATLENVYIRDDTAGWSGVLPYTGTTLVFPGQPGDTYEIALAPVQGWSEIGTRSPWVSVTVP